MATKSKAGISWGEISDYEGCVNEIRRAAVEIQKETRYYEKESGMVLSSGDVYASRIRTYIKIMQTNLAKIDRYYKKYGRM